MKRKLVMNQWTGGAVLAGLSLLSLPALAQEVEKLDSGVATASPPLQEEEQPQGGQQGGRPPITVNSGVAHQFKSDIDNAGSGSFTLTRFHLGAGVPVKINDNWTVRSSLRYGLDSYEWDSVGTPWHNIHTMSLASVATYRQNETWSYFGGGFFRMSAETGVNWGQGCNGGGLGGVRYQVNENLMIGGGLGIMSQLEDPAKVLPLFLCKWKFADQWRLDAGLTDLATVGYGASVTWMPTSEWEFSGGIQYHKSRFRIDGGNDVAKDGIGEESAATVYVASAWHVCPHADLGAFLGAAVGGKVALENKGGNTLFEHDYKPGAVLGINATFKF